MFHKVLFRHLRSLTRHHRRHLCLIVLEPFSSHPLSYKALHRHHNTNGQTADPRVLAVHYLHQLAESAIRVGEQNDYDPTTREQGHDMTIDDRRQL